MFSPRPSIAPYEVVPVQTGLQRSAARLPNKVAIIDGERHETYRQLDEHSDRYGRLANTVTTRSDVFEIIVTVQSGYGVDSNADGRINFRNDTEFVFNAEKKVRTVYER